MERKATLAETTNFGAPTTNSDEMDAGDKKLEPESPAYVAPATPPIMAPVVTIVNPNHIKESHNHLIASHESPRSSLFSSLPFDSVAGPRSDSLPPETASPQPKQFETTSSQDVNIQPVLSSASNETASGETRPNNTVNTITREQDSTIEMYKTEVSVSPAAKEAGDSASISPSSSTSDIDSVLISNTAGGVWTFKMASRKRNDDFHALFPDIPKDDRLIDDFTCAWLNDILIHGRLYISENCLAFHSKLFWTYQVILSYDDITSVERKAVAGLFQNAIEVSTKTTKVMLVFR